MMPTRRFSDEAEKEIVKRYLAGASTVALARDYGTVPNVINAALNRQGIARRTADETRELTRAFVDETLFSGPDLSEYEQYWLGFLMADGCISKSPQSKHLRVNIKLHVRDIEHLRKFNAFLSANNSIFVYGDDCSVCIVSDRLASNLAQWGVVQRKTLVASVHPSLIYSNHFWRGYVDGDGTLVFGRKNTTTYPKLSIVCGSPAMIDQFLLYCESIVGYKTKAQKQPNSKSIKVHYASAAATKLVRSMYMGANIFLHRKNEIAKEMFTWKGKFMKSYLTADNKIIETDYV